MLFRSHCSNEAKKNIDSGLIIKENAGLSLSDKGKLIADRIISDLFFTDFDIP